MELRQKIKKYYYQNSESLPLDKRFHFASRLAAWSGETEAYTQLRQLKPYLTREGDVRQALIETIQSPVANVYAKRQRLEFFDKYPDLYGVHNAFFRIRHLREVYGIDAREELLEIVDKNRLMAIHESLLKDSQAVRILSRFAVDYIYLFEILFNVKSSFEPEQIISLISGYDMNDPTQRHLMVYLLTHSILAESNFYVRPIRDDRITVYRRMALLLEQVFTDYPELKLDTKFEFMVSCRIVGVASKLFAKFEAEAGNCLDTSGNYVIEPSAPSQSAGINDFARSEHRNVLFVMSGTKFTPHKQLAE